MDTPIVPVIVLPEYITSRADARNSSLLVYYCTRCNVWFDQGTFAYYNLYYHLYSRQHMERMELHAANKCNTCNIQFPSRSKMATHVETKRHKLKEAGVYMGNIRCEPCDRTFTCRSHYGYHIETNAHARKLNPPVRDCEICGTHVLSDKQMATHLATNKHKRNAGLVDGSGSS